MDLDLSLGAPAAPPRPSATSWSRRSRPVIEEHEREHKFPVEIVRRLGEMGWLGIPIPEDEGGAGMDTLAYAIAIEEIGRVWGSLGLIVAAHTSLGCGPLHLAGSPGPEGSLPRPDGARRGHRRVRPDGARRRLRRRRHADDRSVGGRRRGRVRARRRAASGSIDGGKRFITNAGQAGTYIITARTGNKDDGNAEISAFILPADTPGFRVGPDRGQARAPRLRDRRAGLRPLPDPGREPARGAW